MTKSETVLNIIKRDGHITRFIAVNYGITALTQHISILRKKGYDLKATARNDLHGNKYTSWSLGNAAEDKQMTLPLAA